MSKKPSECLCLCGLKLKELEDDGCPSHLDNWYVWMERRKKIYEKLARKRRRHPGDLVMNSGDAIRNIKEEKLLIEYARINTYFDKYRGDPNWWKLPWSLKDRSPPFKGTEYFVTETKQMKNQIPDIEYVGIPRVILQEMGLLPRVKKLHKLWQKSTYRKQVLDNLSSKIEKIQPHKPNLSELIIIGSKVKKVDDKPSQKTDEIEQSRFYTRSSITDRSFSTPSLKINKMNYDVQHFSNLPYERNTISLIFEYFVGRTPCKQILTFENTGQVALRLSWSEYKKLRIFREFSNTTTYPVFWFDKNELLILPGEKIEFPIWFQAATIGNYFQYWELTSKPEIWNQFDIKFILLFKGFTYIENFEEKVEEIQNRLQENMRRTAIRDFLNDIINMGIYCDPEPAKNTFTYNEAQLFESFNMIKYFQKMIPQYYYNKEVIRELKQFYKKNRSASDPDKWDLSVTKLIEVARKQDLVNFFENKRIFFLRASLCRAALRRDSNYDAKLEDKKNDKGKGKRESTQLPDMPPPKSVYGELMKIVQKLEKPTIYLNQDREKYFMCYLVLNTYLQTISDNLGKLPCCPYGLGKEISTEDSEENEDVPAPSDTRFQISNFPDRLQFEVFEECYILRKKRMPQMTGYAKPKSLRLKGVDLLDSKKVFKTYFARDAKSPEKDGKTQKHDDSSKVKVKSRTNENLDGYSIPDFDPFSENPYVDMAESEIEISPPSKVSEIKEVNSEVYLSVYITLCEAVETLVDTIDTFRDSNISSYTLGELRKCDQYFKMPSEVLADSTTSSHSVLIKDELLLANSNKYFDYLQKTHLNDNPHTKNYYIGGKHFPEKPTEIVEMPKKILSNYFSQTNFIRKPILFGLEESEAQTDGGSLQDEDFLSEERKEVEHTGEDAEVVSSSSSRNLFYFLDHCENQRDE